MDNRNMYTNPMSNYYPYSYPAATAPIPRPEAVGYMMPQVPVVAPMLKGRPVSSLEEARVSQIDLDGSVFFFPDLGNGKIYTKKINPDGTAAISVYAIDSAPMAPTVPEYVTREEVEELRKTLGTILAKLEPAKAEKPAAPKISF